MEKAAAGIVNGIWDLLAMGKESVVNISDVGLFDWNRPNAIYGSSIHAILFGRLAQRDSRLRETSTLDIITDTDEGIEQRLKLLKFATAQGASPHIIAPETCDNPRSWSLGGDDDGDLEETNMVIFAGKTALQCLLSLENEIRALEDWEKNWARDIAVIDRALSTLLKRPSSEATARVNIHEGLLEMWARILSNADSTDVIISVQGQGSSGSETQEVYGHRVVLCEASPVLKAMLTGSMREGVSQKISLDECSVSAVRLLVSLLYTGSLPGNENEPCLTSMLDALVLGHRWQVQHVIDIITPATIKRLDIENLEVVLGVALRMQDLEFLSVCRSFISGHAEDVSAKLSKTGVQGFTDEAVAAEIRRTLSRSTADSTSRAKKRRRVL